MIKAKRHPTGLVPLVCYCLALAIWLGGAILLWLGDRSLPQRRLARTEWEWINLEQQDTATMLATTDDPQMLWVNTEGLHIRTLTLSSDWAGLVGEVCLYYTRSETEGFGLDNRIYPRVEPDGSFFFVLPAGEIHALRVDVGSRAGPISAGTQILNRPASLRQYLLPGWRQGLWLCLVPGLAASAFCLGLDGWRILQNNKKGF